MLHTGERNDDLLLVSLDDASGPTRTRHYTTDDHAWLIGPPCARAFARKCRNSIVRSL